MFSNVFEGGITPDKIPANVQCTTKYKEPTSRSIMRRLAKKPRIVGGDNVDLNTWGWYARLERIPGDGYVYTCGATIIGQRWLLTAAHCTAGDSAKYPHRASERAFQCIFNMQHAVKKPHRYKHTVYSTVGLIEKL